MSNILNNLLPRIIVPFWCEKINNRPRLLFEETPYFNLFFMRRVFLDSMAMWNKLLKDFSQKAFRLLTELSYPKKLGNDRTGKIMQL